MTSITNYLRFNNYYKIYLLIILNLFTIFYVNYVTKKRYKVMCRRKIIIIYKSMKTYNFIIRFLKENILFGYHGPTETIVFFLKINILLFLFYVKHFKQIYTLVFF